MVERTHTKKEKAKEENDRSEIVSSSENQAWMRFIKIRTGTPTTLLEHVEQTTISCLLPLSSSLGLMSGVGSYNKLAVRIFIGLSSSLQFDFELDICLNFSWQKEI